MSYSTSVIALAERMKAQLDGMSEHDAYRAAALAIAVLGEREPVPATDARARAAQSADLPIGVSQ